MSRYKQNDYNKPDLEMMKSRLSKAILHIGYAKDEIEECGDYDTSFCSLMDACIDMLEAEITNLDYHLSILPKGNALPKTDVMKW